MASEGGHDRVEAEHPPQQEGDIRDGSGINSHSIILGRSVSQGLAGASTNQILKVTACASSPRPLTTPLDRLGNNSTIVILLRHMLNDLDRKSKRLNYSH